MQQKVSRKHVSAIETHLPDLARFIPGIWADYMEAHDYMGARTWISALGAGVTFGTLLPMKVRNEIFDELCDLEQIATLLHRGAERRVDKLHGQTCEVFHIAGHQMEPATINATKELSHV